MANITQEQINQILQKAPAGTTELQLKSVLQKRGHTIQEAPKQNLLQKLGKGLDVVFGGGKIGEAIGGGIAKLGLTGLNKEQRQFVDMPSAKAVLGDVAGVGLTLGTLGAGTPASLGGKVALGAGLGAGFGATGALREDQGVGDVAKGALGGAVLGGALPVAGRGLSKTGDFFANTFPRQLENLGLKVPAKKAGLGIADAFAKRNLGGKPLSEVERITSKEISTVNSKIEKALSSPKVAKVKISNNDFISQVARDINKQTGSRLSTNNLKARIAKFAPDFAPVVRKKQITLKEANSLKIAITNNLKEASFLGKELTGEQKAVKRFAGELSKVIKTKSGTEALFKQESEAIRINRAVADAIRKFETQGRPGDLLDLTGLGLGGAVGSIPGAVIGYGLQRAGRSPRVLTGVARGLRATRGITQGKIPQATGRLSKYALFQALKNSQ